MTDADPFLEAVWANPDDDLPRLVYADWLEERGEATYAEFIRVDCRLARREPQSQLDRARLRQRRHDLRTRLAADWKDALGDRGGWILHENKRGLFEPTVYINADTFLQLSPNWWPRILIRDLHIRQFDGYEAEVAAAPYLSRVCRLAFGYPWETENGWAQPDEMIGHLARVNHMSRLIGLAYGPVRASRSSLRALARASYLNLLDDGGLFVRVILTDEPDADEQLVFADIYNPDGTAAEAVERFLASYGDQLPAE